MISTRKRDVKLKSGTIIDTVILVPSWYCTNYYSCAVLPMQEENTVQCDRTPTRKQLPEYSEISIYHAAAS